MAVYQIKFSYLEGMIYRGEHNSAEEAEAHLRELLRADTVPGVVIGEITEITSMDIEEQPAIKRVLN